MKLLDNTNREYFEDLVAEAAHRELGYVFVLESIKSKNIVLKPIDIEYISDELAQEYRRILCYAYREGLVFVSSDDVKNVAKSCKELLKA